MTLLSLKQELSGNTYPGRGIVAGRSADGRYAVTAYFIMGRSVNSRNRVFITDGEGIRTQAFDPSKLTDPSLIIYAPVRVLGEHTIVTNGDQTDTVYDGLKAGKTFAEALESREFEPDAPNYTPRISALLTVKDGAYSCRMSILKSADGNYLARTEVLGISGVQHYHLVPKLVVLLEEFLTVHKLFRKEAGISRIHNLHLAHHLSYDDLEVLVVDLHALHSVNRLYLVDDVLLDLGRTEDTENVCRSDATV